MYEFSSGAKSSAPALRYDLIPSASLRAQATRMMVGASSHGERNYEKGWNDPVFLTDRKNHLLAHVLALLDGDTTDDHLGAILANAGMLAQIAEIQARHLRQGEKVVAFPVLPPPSSRLDK